MERDRLIWCLFISTAIHLLWVSGPSRPQKEESRTSQTFEVAIIHQSNQQKPLASSHISNQDHQNQDPVKTEEQSEKAVPAAPPTPALWLQALTLPQDVGQKLLPAPPASETLKKRRITINTAQAHEAEYLYAWRKRIEEYGNAMYSKMFMNQKVYGELTLLVSISHDGELKEAKILQSSGIAALDAASLTIVREAAPFAPLPPEIRKDADVLEIERILKFQPR